jgi:hypothetical protein
MEATVTSRYATASMAVLILFLSLPSVLASDKTAAGLFIGVEGEVRLRRAGSPEATELGWIDVTFGMPVYPGDSIKTGKDGRAMVKMEDRLLGINPGSLFHVPDSSPVADHDQHWKQLTDDLGVMLWTDVRGVTRGRLYVRIDDKWTAVALESPEEFLPDVLPLGH